jgi:hypothetical protein
MDIRIGPHVVLIITEPHIPSFDSFYLMRDATVSYLHIIHPSHISSFSFFSILFIKVGLWLSNILMVVCILGLGFFCDIVVG